MAFRNFPGKDQQWLETKLNLILEDLAAGKRLTSWGAGSDSASRQVETSAEAVRTMLLNDLYLLDPTTYPLDSFRRIKSTTAIFRDS